MRKKLEGGYPCILTTDSWALQVALVVKKKKKHTHTKNPSTNAGNIRDTGLIPG